MAIFFFNNFSMDHVCVKRMVKNVSTLWNKELEEINMKRKVWIRNRWKEETQEASALLLEDP
jgi:hypothetical protein